MGERGALQRKQARGDREAAESEAAFNTTLAEVPRATKKKKFTICFDLPAADCEPIKGCMNEVGEVTGTKIDLQPAPKEGHHRFPMSRLTIDGFTPDVYTAHMNLMWAMTEEHEAADNDVQRDHWGGKRKVRPRARGGRRHRSW